MSTASPAPPAAPAVVAVVVTHDPGDWFEEALAAFAAQDYPSLSVLVIDAGSAEDPTPRVAAVLPTAFVRRLDGNVGFAAAANEVGAMVEGAAFFAFCHDDIAPEPDAIRLLVEEAFRSNAGVVGPKLVSWGEPERLLQVGLAVDKTGVTSNLVERGELDQEQHDGVRDVFAVPGGLTLVRADLFGDIGGYDPAMALMGEDVDLCWRAQVAGARVIVAPAARVAHLEALGRRGRAGERGRLAAEHRLRSVLKNYSALHLARVLPQAATMAVLEAAQALATGHRDRARSVLGAWTANATELGDIRAGRRRVRATRRFPDNEVRRLQARGSLRARAFLRGQLGGEHRAEALARTGRELADFVRSERAVVTAALALVLLIGTRSLLGGPLAAIGELSPFPSAGTLLRHFWSGWRVTGLGSEAPAPPAFLGIGAAGLVLLGKTALVQKVLVLGAIPFGLVGMWRLARPFASARAGLAAVVAYAVVPLPYNALARGRWSGLVAYAVTPWVLRALARAGGIAPFHSLDGPRLLAPALRLGAGLALATALAPWSPLLAVVVAGGIVAGSALGGAGGPEAARAIRVSALAVAVAAVLLFPWTLDLLAPGADVSAIAGVAPGAGRGLSLGHLLRFETGPIGAGVLGWALLVAAALPLLVGLAERFAWAVLLWSIALLSIVLALLGGRGWLAGLAPAPEVLLAPAAVALALAVGLGMAAFETDLLGFHFGWRQAASVAAGVALVLATLPVLTGAREGRWRMPTTDHARALAWMPAERAEGSFRILWIGDPGALPLPGWRLSAGLAYATSRDGLPDLTASWPHADPGPTRLLADAVQLARRGGTSRLGHLLAPMAVRYVVVAERAAADAGHAPALPVPADLVDGLGDQLDLRKLESVPALHVYENVAWNTGRVAMDAPSARASRGTGLLAARGAELPAGTPVLTRSASPTRFTGTVPDGRDVLLSEAYSSRWSLRVSGAGAPRRRAFGWATAFTPADGGEATLRHRTSPVRPLSLLVALVLWVGLVRRVRRDRRARAAVAP